MRKKIGCDPEKVDLTIFITNSRDPENYRKAGVKGPVVRIGNVLNGLRMALERDTGIRWGPLPKRNTPDIPQFYHFTMPSGVDYMSAYMWHFALDCPMYKKEDLERNGHEWVK